ncbi:MAG: hypothetical protein WDW38_001074 [Sanguina aurantia]
MASLHLQLNNSMRYSTGCVSRRISSSGSSSSSDSDHDSGIDGRYHRSSGGAAQQSRQQHLIISSTHARGIHSYALHDIGSSSGSDDEDHPPPPRLQPSISQAGSTSTQLPGHLLTHPSHPCPTTSVLDPDLSHPSSSLPLPTHTGLSCPLTSASIDRRCRLSVSPPNKHQPDDGILQACPSPVSGSDSNSLHLHSRHGLAAAHTGLGSQGQHCELDSGEDHQPACVDFASASEGFLLLPSAVARTLSAGTAPLSAHHQRHQRGSTPGEGTVARPSIGRLHTSTALTAAAATPLQPSQSQPLPQPQPHSLPPFSRSRSCGPHSSSLSLRLEQLHTHSRTAHPPSSGHSTEAAPGGFKSSSSPAAAAAAGTVAAAQEPLSPQPSTSPPTQQPSVLRCRASPHMAPCSDTPAPIPHTVAKQSRRGEGTPHPGTQVTSSHRRNPTGTSAPTAPSTHSYGSPSLCSSWGCTSSSSSGSHAHHMSHQPVTGFGATASHGHAKARPTLSPGEPSPSLTCTGQAPSCQEGGSHAPNTRDSDSPGGGRAPASCDSSSRSAGSQDSCYRTRTGLPAGLQERRADSSSSSSQAHDPRHSATRDSSRSHSSRSSVTADSTQPTPSKKGCSEDSGSHPPLSRDGVTQRRDQSSHFRGLCTMGGSQPGSSRDGYLRGSGQSGTSRGIVRTASLRDSCSKDSAWTGALREEGPTDARSSGRRASVGDSVAGEAPTGQGSVLSDSCGSRAGSQAPLSGGSCGKRSGGFQPLLWGDSISK